MTVINSNLVSRVLVSIVAIPAVLFISYTGGIVFFLFVAAICCLALNEFYSLAVLKGASPQRAPGIVAAFLLNVGFLSRMAIRSIIVPLFFGEGITVPLFFTGTQFFVLVLLVFLADSVDD